MIQHFERFVNKKNKNPLKKQRILACTSKFDFITERTFHSLRVTAPTQQRSEKASRRRKLIGKAPLRKRISPKRACKNAHQFPMGKVKSNPTRAFSADCFVSIPYGKGKVEHARKNCPLIFVSIPYGKGKARISISQRACR